MIVRLRLPLVASLALVLLALAAPVVQAASGRATFIVVLKDSAGRPGAVAAEHARTFDADVRFVYRHALNGYAARMDGSQLGALRADRRVAYVERDQRVTVDATQSGAVWGLDRIDQRALPLVGGYSYDDTGSGVTAYVIDTGIRTTHSEFGGRASSGYDAIDGGTADDCHGHGTHVAGTIGGSTYGVAKAVSLVAVRVLDCNGSGSWAGVIAGIDWAITNHTSGPAVANMSLGGGASTAVDTAVKNGVADGITFVVAAGNSNQDACRFSPAGVPEAITVGATTSSDAKASYSNFGPCLDLFAPGSSVKSAYSTSNTATATMSGTSMASPHVAGVAALYLDQEGSKSPATVAGAIVGNATPDVVSGLSGSKKRPSSTPNRLLYTDY